MSEINCDMAVLGGGPAGYVGAIRAAQLGANVVLIEKNALGGVCMNVGCIPTKALIKSAEVLSTIKRSKEFGALGRLDGLSWDTAVSRKDRVVKNLGMGIKQLMLANGITVLKGEGTIVSPNELHVKNESEEIRVHCKKLLLATGSEPLIPSFIKGIEQHGVMTSTQALSLTEIPSSTVVIGGGVIGVEFATMLSAAGSKVQILELQDRILPSEDEEIASKLLKILKRQGIKFKLSAKVSEITEGDDGLSVHYQMKEEKFAANCNKVLLAVGRSLNSHIASVLNLDTDKGRIIVDEHMQTSIPGVYAAGDVIGGKLLAHLAFMEGRCAAENAMGQSTTINYNTIPACVYTTPESATVGLTEKEALAKGMTPKTGRFELRHNGRALTLGEREGFVKIVADENGVIIGGQILGENASEMISEITLAITLGVKAEVLADMIHPHPSISEAIWEACGEIAEKAIHKA